MKRTLGTFAITVVVACLIIAGIVYPAIGGAIVAAMVFAAMWGMTDMCFGHHFDNQ